MYALLGNDVEDDELPKYPIKEIVKKSTSTRKADVPPPSADPAKAKKKAKLTGNEAAIKEKDNNRSVAGPSSTPSKHFKKNNGPHTKYERSDSAKKVRQGWGTGADREAEAEAEGAEDAEAELESEAAEAAEPATPKKSLQDYFAELKLKQAELEGNKTIRQANQGNEDKWAATEKIEKEQETYVAPTAVKKNKSKAHKEKTFLEFNAVFADQQPARAPRTEEKRGPRPTGKPSARGGKRTGGKPTGGKPAGASKPAAKAELNDKNFPSL